jgi:hypothetical protein
MNKNQFAGMTLAAGFVVAGLLLVNAYSAFTTQIHHSRAAGYGQHQKAK